MRPVATYATTPRSTRPTRRSSSILIPFLAALALFAQAATSARAVNCGVESRLLGFIDSVDSGAGTMTIEGFTVGTDGETRYRDQNGDDLTFAAFAAGQYVEVQYCPDPGPPPIATRIDQENPAGGCEDEVRGFIEALDVAGGTATIAGFTVNTTAFTEYLDDENNPLPNGLGSFATGDFVEAEGCFQMDGSLLSEKIKIEDGDDDDNFAFEFRGYIASTDPLTKTLVVADRNVTTTSGTRYLDDDNNPLPNGFDSLTAGQFVEVEGATLATGFFAATKIKFEDDHGTGIGAELEIRGEVESIDAAASSLVINGVLVNTNAQTSFLGFQNETVAFSAFAVGDFAEAEGAFQSNGSLLARKVKMEDRVTAEWSRRGQIDSIDGATFVVGGESILSGPNTVFLGLNNETIAIGDFAAGQFVEAEGAVSADGALRARKIKREDGLGGNGCVATFFTSGTIANIDAMAGTFNFGGELVVATDAGTLFENEARLPILFADLVVGDFVEARGNLDANNALLACKVERRNAGNGGIDDNGGGDPLSILSGSIAMLNLDLRSFFLGETMVVATATTEVEGRQGVPLTFDALADGMAVVVRGRRLVDGRFSATHIRVQEDGVNPNEDAFVLGVIASLALPDSLTLDTGDVVAVDGSTVVSLVNDAVGTLNDLAAGDLVKAEGLIQMGGGILATRVEVRGSTVSSIDSGAMSLVVGNTTVFVSGATQIREADNSPLAFADLAVGDLLKVEGAPAAAGELNANQITRLAAAAFSGAIAGFDPPAFTIANGLPTLSTTSNSNVFGYVSTPSASFGADANSLYEVTAVVSTNVANRQMVPQVRLRVNNDSFQKGMLLDVLSNGASRFSPTPEGFAQKLYFVPAAPATTGPQANLTSWFFSLDLANVLGADEANASVSLSSLTVVPIERSRVQVAETLASYDFANGAQGWTAGGAAGFYTIPAATSGRFGTLDLAATDQNTFGFWEIDTKAPAQANSLYRGRFLVRSSSQTGAQVPAMRVRLNLSTYELASVVNIESIGQGEESPDGAGRIYDVYMHVPADATGATFRAAFDLANVVHPEDDTNKAVSLDGFTLERVEIAPAR
jgi:hypothetical protein